MIIFRGLVQILSLNSNVFFVPNVHILEFSCILKLLVSLNVEPHLIHLYNLANLSILVI